jgi:metallo-beta-lactamase family protein
MTPKLTFLGAVGTVTGSKYLVESAGRRILIDCGLFQGYKQLRLRNWAKLPVDPATIDAVLLTHAHIDHSGYLPLLVKDGFRGPVICTDATHDLCGILLPDSGYLQERDAEFANRHGYSKHKPALPLYTQEDAETALKRFRPVPFDKTIALPGGLEARFVYAGHILGASMIELTCSNRKLLFSGDLGRPNDILLHGPARVEAADYLIVESTYGDRTHPTVSAADALGEIIGQTAARGGTVLIPAFAVGRSQELLVYLDHLKRAKRIPDLPIFLDSPMAIDASDIFCRYGKYHRMSERDTRSAFRVAKYVMTTDESKSLDVDGHPKVIISASGMATGGRILHHLKSYAPDSRNTIVFVGFQAGGTRGAALISGAPSVKIHGQYVTVRARVEHLQMLSAHADAEEIFAWLHQFNAPPKMTFVTHGEQAASDVLRHRIAEELGWDCTVPEYCQGVELP